MKNATKENLGPSVVFTLQVLEKLKAGGFRYVRVNAFTTDKRMDYIEPHYFMLTPLKELPDDINKKGIYEPINSPLLIDWANFPNEGIKVFVTTE